MDALPDYEFYKTRYGGDLSNEAFNRLSGRASACLSAMTLGRSRTTLPQAVDESVKMAICALSDAMHKAENGGEIQSESNDGISVTYAQKTQESDEKRFYHTVKSYLAWTGLLYRGCL